MGKHHCKICCRSHELPPISNFKIEVDYTICQSIQTSTCQLADLEPGSARRAVPIELVVAASDFSEEHVFSNAVLPIISPEQTSGFWSRIYKGVGPTNEPVVVKLYKRQENFSQRQVIDRFHRELLAMGTLGEHQGFVRCLGFGFTADVWPYIVMEDGGVSLGMLWRRGKSVAAKPLASQLLSGLEEMHLLGLCHCDIHEDNLLLSSADRQWSDRIASLASGGKAPFVLKIADCNSVQECELQAEPVSTDAREADSVPTPHSTSLPDAAGSFPGLGARARARHRLLVVEGKQAQSPVVTKSGRRAPPAPPGKKLELSGGVTEPLGAVRDGQGAGRIMLRAVDPAACQRIFGAEHLGTLDDWAAVAAAVSASKLQAPWRGVFRLLLHPRGLAPSPYAASVPYTIPEARALLEPEPASTKPR